uniref:Uncharacterized protein n=1 Tax=Pinctada fucata TaxID=50426 RepID=A0A194AQW5_PINFU
MFGIALGYSISAVVAADSKHYSSTTKTSTYLSHADQLQNIGIIIILLSVVMGVTSVYGFIFFIRKRKLFGFYSRGEQELLKRISSLENQVDDLRGQNQQGYGTAGMGNTYGEVDKTGLRQENYNQWPEKPPEYSKS